jgi:hypothetical protein
MLSDKLVTIRQCKNNIREEWYTVEALAAMVLNFRGFRRYFECSDSFLTALQNILKR